jgi:hypothetical protein
VFRTEGVRIVRSPVRSPKANAVCERWVGTVRRECLDHVLVLGRQHLKRVLTSYVAHDNGQRPHRALDLQTPELRGDPPVRVSPEIQVASWVSGRDAVPMFLVARNPQPDTKLPFLVKLPWMAVWC